MVETDWIASKTADGSWCDIQLTDNNNISHDAAHTNGALIVEHDA